MPVTIKRKRRLRKIQGADRAATVYAAGKIQQAQKGQRAGDFGPAGSDFVVTRGKSEAKIVNARYVLRPGDTLVVTRRGVAGIGNASRENGFAIVARRSIVKNREVLLALAKL